MKRVLKRARDEDARRKEGREDGREACVGSRKSGIGSR